MSVLTARAAIAQRLAFQELHGTFTSWLMEHNETVDADGNQVVCVFGPDESAHQAMVEVLRYDHPVAVASAIDDQLIAVQIGDLSVAPGPGSDDTDDTVVRIEDQTVAEVMRLFRDRHQASGVVFEFSLSGDRVLVTA